MTSPTRSFGLLPDGRQTLLYTIENDTLRVRISDFGARIVSMEARRHDGGFDHLALGFESAADYARSGASFGALLGRCANRIAGGRFTLDGQTYELSRNERDNTLHGGAEGFSRRVWSTLSTDAASLVLRLVSPDGDQGFPGELVSRVRFAVEGETLSLDMEATTSKPTPVNLSAHPYFNLGGENAIDALDHELTVFADHYLPVDAAQIPTGEVKGVGGPFDFRTPAVLASRIRSPDPQLLIGKGYDHCFVLDERDLGALRPAVRLRHPGNGRVLDVATTCPAVQVYSGNNLNGAAAGRGGAYRQSAGLAFEPEGFPDAPNQPRFPSVILRPGEVWRRQIRYRFGLEAR